jgi:carboxypeptidase C (cathepsin A)
LQPYFRDRDIVAGIYGFNTEIVYDSQADDVYNYLYTDFMQTEINRVEYLLGKGLPILIYNGQDDLIVQNAGTMKWADKIYYASASEFRKKLFEAWTINGKTVGAKKSAGLLELRIVFNAGHLVPMDRPEESLDMATSFVNRVVSI